MEKIEILYIAAGNAKCYSYFGKQLINSSNGSRVTIWPSNSTGKHTPKGNEKHMSTQTLVQECFVAMLFIIAQKQKQLNVALNWRTDKKCVTYTLVYYSATKRNKILILATTWMDLKNFMLKWKRQSQKMTYCMISCIWNFQKRQIYRDGK